MKSTLVRISTEAVLLVVLAWLLASCGGSRTSGRLVGAPLAAPTTGRASTAPVIPLADVLAQIDAYPVPKGVSPDRWATLTSALKQKVSALGASGKTFSSAPTGTNNAVSDLAAAANGAGTQATVTWTEKLWGDYNNDGSVDIGDLAPMAQYYGADITAPPANAHMLVNAGDGTNSIDIDDLQPIAADYSMHLQGYVVWRGHFNGTSVDWETTPRPNPNAANPNWSADRPSSPPVSTRPAYTYTDDLSAVTDKANVRYKVTAYGDGAAGVESNVATMPPPGPPTYSVSGTVTFSSAGLSGVTLTLTPSGLNATSASDGTYSINNVGNGTYTLTPSKTNYTFAPPTRTVMIADASVTGQDFAAQSAGLPNAPWPKFRHDALNTGQSQYVGSQSAGVKWTYSYGGASASSPAIAADGTIYIGGGNSNLVAVKPDGTLAWQEIFSDAVNSSPAIGADGTIYLGSLNFGVYALNPADGSVKWSFATGSAIGTGGPSIGPDGTVYVPSMDGALYAFNPSDGSVKWSHMTGNNLQCSPAIGSDGTICFGSEDGKLYALNPLDGSLKWSFTTGAYINSSPAIASDGTVIFGCEDHYVYALNPADGSMRWNYLTNNAVDSSPAISADGTLYIGSADTHLYALNALTGSFKWSYATGNGVTSSPAVGSDGIVYFGGIDNSVYALRPDGTLLWSYATGLSVSSSPAIAADGTVYVGSNDGNLYAFGP